MGRHTSEERRPHRRPGRRGRGALAASLLVGLIGSGAFIWHGTNAAFTASTSNDASSWAVGSVSLTEDGSGSALFNATNLKPGESGTPKCIVVSYTGTLEAAVRLYVSDTDDDDGIAQYVDIRIEEGTGGTWGSCTGFSPSSTLHDGPLSTFSAAHNVHGNGASSWTPNGAATRSFRFTYTLSGSTPDAAQGKSTSATFTWEAQST